MRVSLVVPIRNEKKTLAALFESIGRQTRPPDEVILVDGGSTDQTVASARSLTDDDPRCRLLEAGEATPGRGRNVGIAAANHDWIALTDAGIQLEPAWLEQLLGVIDSDPSVRIVYGNYEPLANTWFERCAALAYPPPKQGRPGGRMRGPSIASCLLHREVWKAAGGFPDLRAAEDLIFMQCIEEQGHKIGWAPAATVWWQLQPSFSLTFRKFVMYSRHNAWAGQQRSWHHGILRQYLAALPFLGLAAVYTPWWLVLPALGAVARVVKSIWIRREGRGLPWLMDPVQFLGVGLVLATIDAATFIGWVQALCSSKPQQHVSSENCPVSSHGEARCPQ